MIRNFLCTLKIVSSFIHDIFCFVLYVVVAFYFSLFFPNFSCRLLDRFDVLVRNILFMVRSRMERFEGGCADFFFSFTLTLFNLGFELEIVLRKYNREKTTTYQSYELRRLCMVGGEGWDCAE